MQEAAARAHVSEFHFRHIFTELCGLTVGEYIRNRRLTLAARELSSRTARVVDVAVKYGYDSPDSLAPLEIHLPPKDKAVTEYEIMEKAALSESGVPCQTFPVPSCRGRTTPVFPGAQTVNLCL